MNFQAYCFACEKRVSALTILNTEGLWQALDKDADIEVMHVSDRGDHRWKLNSEERERLRRIVLPRAFTSEQVTNFLAEYGYTANPQGLAGPFPVDYISENVAYLDVNAEAVRKGDEVPDRPIRITTYLVFDGVSTHWKLKSVEELAEGIKSKHLDRDKKLTPKIWPWPKNSEL